MTEEAIDALVAERDRVLRWADAQEHWEAPSGCARWSRLDVVRHLADLFGRVVDPARAPTRHDDADTTSAAGIAMTADWSPEGVVARYESTSRHAIDRLAELQAPVVGDLLVHFGSLGRHPAHLWADGLVYEHVVHVGLDLGVDTGIDRQDPASLVPAVGWLLSVVPQVCDTRLRAALRELLCLRIGPPVDGAVTLRSVGEAVAVGTGEARDRAAAVTVAPIALIAATAGRACWSALDTAIDGDRALTRTVLAGLVL